MIGHLLINIAVRGFIVSDLKNTENIYVITINKSGIYFERNQSHTTQRNALEIDDIGSNYRFLPTKITHSLRK
ncbi:hypothetical protein VS_1693 [Vibrio atlanticus]|uniref:Uncharacterized protein n=1 Tax=Vibrio atlanticus (strain LGP32) TaxID=575788 RepID=B7VPC8_VIBA3|nr:hypothetical protein VS_1693 [Vibrio atlanticus]